MLHRPAGLALAVAALLVPASAAVAAPVTVNLRIEGPTATVFEGPVTTDVAPFRFTAGADTAAHECDGTAVNSGTSPVPVPTRGAALAAAAIAAPFATAGSFNAQFGSPSFDSVGGQPTPFDPATGAFLVEYKNGVSASLGSCGDPIANGDDVLFAYGPDTAPLLRLSGPATAVAGTPIPVHVADQTGAPVAGAAVGGATTDAAGNAAVSLSQAGAQSLKATKDGAIRSNALAVSVGTVAAPAAQGVAGATVDRTAPRARLLSPRDGATYKASGFVPRLIRIAVTETGSGVRTVKLRLTRRAPNGRCFSYSGRRDRFIGVECGHGFYFTVSDRADVSFLLPARPARGRYVLDVEAIDRSFNRDATPERGRNRSVFVVS